MALVSAVGQLGKFQVQLHIDGESSPRCVRKCYSQLVALQKSKCLHVPRLRSSQASFLLISSIKILNSPQVQIKPTPQLLASYRYLYTVMELEVIRTHEHSRFKKIGHILLILLWYQFWAPSASARVEAICKLRRSMPKMVIRVSKGEPA